MNKITVPILCLIGLLILFGNQEKPQDFVFNTPAYQGSKDVQDKEKLEALEKKWDEYMNRFSTTASVYNLSGGLDYTAPGPWYLNPKDSSVDMRNPDLQVPIRWEAFPGRSLHFYKTRFDTLFPHGRFTPPMEFFEMVDIGPAAFREKYGELGRKAVYLETDYKCAIEETDFIHPLGPRGWLDEYCEMSTQRNNENKLSRLHFTCENPEYYWILWQVDPEAVLKIYQDVIGGDRDIKLEDLYLMGADKKRVIDPATGKACYNPINKWNSGTQMTSDYGGAMHLTSAPNEVSAEIVLAGGAAVLRDTTDEVQNIANSLINCSDYGQIFRHSDPHIGQNAYQVVDALNLRITLLNPVGLYLQEPNYSYFTLPNNAPEGAKIQDCFKFVRGKVNDPNYPNNMILHIVMEIPESWGDGFTLEDIKVLNQPIKYGSQVMQSIKVQLAATGKSGGNDKPERKPCAAENQVPAINYFVYNDILDGSLHNGLIDSANVTPLALAVEAGKTTGDIALVLGNVGKKDYENIEISAYQGAVQDTTIKFEWSFTNELSTPLKCEIGPRYNLKMTVPADATIGDYGLLVKNLSNNEGIPVPSVFQVTSPK